MAKLKIQKTYTGGSGYQAGASIVVDSYANNQKLAANGVASSTGTYEGGVGGYTSQTIATIQPTVKVRSATATTGSIIAQKGAHKFLVAKAADIQDENIIAGNTYMISDPSNTDWTQFGAGPNAAQGDIFTATINGSAAVVDNGTVWDVGVCVLSNTGSPTAGYMSVEFSVSSDSTLVFASYITNKWVRDWNGMTYQNYSNSNAGTNNYSNEHFYPTNFFTDIGTVTWSGAEVINNAQAQNGSLPLAQVVRLTT